MEQEQQECQRQDTHVYYEGPEVKEACRALLIDRKAWRAHGAMALRWTGAGFELSAARPAGYERPWARGPHDVESTPTPTRPAAPDATPKADDLEAGD